MPGEPEGLTEVFERSAESIRNKWNRPNVTKNWRADSLPNAERENLKQLWLGVKQLRLEREVP